MWNDFLIKIPSCAPLKIFYIYERLYGNEKKHFYTASYFFCFGTFLLQKKIPCRAFRR